MNQQQKNRAKRLALMAWKNFFFKLRQKKFRQAFIELRRDYAEAVKAAKQP